MPKGTPHPRLSSSDDDEDDTTPLCELKGVQAAKTAKTAAAAFKEKAAADNAPVVPSPPLRSLDGQKGGSAACLSGQDCGSRFVRAVAVPACLPARRARLDAPFQLSVCSLNAL